MSISASIDIKLAKLNNNIVSPMEIIRSLLHYGWTFNDNGQVMYLLIGDKDTFDWKIDTTNQESLLKLLTEKENRGEIVGVVITWSNTGIGGTLLFFEKSSITINLTINRKTIKAAEEIEITDVNWYLTKLVPALKHNNHIIESILFKEHI